MAKLLPTREQDPFMKDIFDSMSTAMMIVIAMVVFIPRIISAFGITRLQTQQYQGLIDSRVLQATPILQWINLLTDPPYTAWVTASFFNDGLLVSGVVIENSVFISINNPDEMHELKFGETYDVDMTTGGRGIETVYYRGDVGATVRVVGKY